MHIPHSSAGGNPCENNIPRSGQKLIDDPLRGNDVNEVNGGIEGNVDVGVHDC
jgi:hypothetical protein